MKDLKSKWELVEGQDFKKMWEEKKSVREAVCEYLTKEARRCYIEMIKHQRQINKESTT